MAPKDGKALMAFLLSDKKTPEEAAQGFVTEMKVTALENKKLTVNGLPAVAVVSQQTSQDQQTGAQNVVKFLSYFIQYNGQVFSFHGVTAEADFMNYVPVFRGTMEKFDKLTDAAKLNVKPERIKIYEVPKTQTLSEVFKSQKIADSRLKELALLNNLELTDKVEKGRLLKLVAK
jgi:predicted Zn-dependent protease